MSQSQNQGLEVVDAAVAAHNAVVTLTAMYGALLEQKQRELALANMQVVQARADAARERSAWEAQRVAGQAHNEGLLNDKKGLIEDLNREREKSARLLRECERLQRELNTVAGTEDS